MSGSRADYEQEVRAIDPWAVEQLRQGKAIEIVARDAVAMRNALKRQYRKGLDDAVLRLIERRNMTLYGGPVGPTADAMLERYGDWRSVIAAAARPKELQQGGLNRIMPLRSVK